MKQCSVLNCTNAFYCKAKCKEHYNLEWRNQNRAQLNADARERYKTCDKAAHRARNQSWRSRNPDAVRKHGYKSQRTLGGQFTKLKNSAKRSGQPSDITREHFEVLRTQPCFYCTAPLPLAGHGLDRIDPQKGYTLDNVRPCCTDCNVAKNNLAESEFIKWLLRIQNNYLKKLTT